MYTQGGSFNQHLFVAVTYAEGAEDEWVTNTPPCVLIATQIARVAAEGLLN